MSAPAATVTVSRCRAGPPAWGLQARAKAVSAKANTMPPWAMPKPLTISARSSMEMVALPSLMSRTSMPSQADAASETSRGWAGEPSGVAPLSDMGPFLYLPNVH